MKSFWQLTTSMPMCRKPIKYLWIFQAWLTTSYQRITRLNRKPSSLNHTIKYTECLLWQWFQHELIKCLNKMLFSLMHSTVTDQEHPCYFLILSILCSHIAIILFWVTQQKKYINCGVKTMLNRKKWQLSMCCIKWIWCWTLSTVIYTKFYFLTVLPSSCN